MNENDEIYELALNQINEVMLENGTQLNNYGFVNIPDYLEIDHLISKSLQKTEVIEFENNLKKLTIEQRQIFDSIMIMVTSDEQNKKDNLMFIDAPGGTGKSYVLNLVIQQCIILGHNPIAVASSGIAALLLKNGRTAHYTFKIPLEVDEFSTCKFKDQSEIAEVFKKTKLIIWDEAPMSKKYTIEAVEKSLRNLKNDNLFGGKAMVFSGDFRQILPVVNFGKQEEAISLSIKRSYIWPKVKVYHLTKNIRIVGQDLESQKFADFLIELGEDKIIKDDENTIEIPEQLFTQKNNLKDFINEVFQSDGNLNFENQAILAPKNEDVNEINQIILEELFKDQELFVSKSMDECINDDEDTLPIEFLNTLEPSGLPPHKLELKLGCIVMLLRNLYPKKGFCNGTRCKVIQITPNYLTLEIINGQYKGQTTAVSKIVLQSNISKSNLFIIKRKQFPVKLAFCITINKSQGQTYERLGIYLKDQVFSLGQLYVALSRCRNYRNIKIFASEKRLKNVVFKKIFK